VAAHVERFRTLTVPELKEEAERRNLDKSGKKNQLLVRLSVWVRDEIVKAAGVSEKMDDDDDPVVTDVSEEQVVDDSDDESADSSDSNSSEELEFCDDGSHGEDHHDDEAMEEIDEDKSREDSGDLEADPQTSQLRSTLRTVFGHDNFREGQEWAIKRCLEQKKTLLVAPTGFGKSLCYALPATLMEGVCVVVSPLISLIQDQLRSLPPRVPAATLSGSPSAAQTAAIIDDIEQGRIKILFVSPERLVSPSFRRLFHMRWNPETKVKERRFPVISLLCIDEAHCASHWAHNFRPCFLRFKSLLNLMQPRSVLAITATAGPRVIADINNTLGIQDCSEISTCSDSVAPAQKDGILVMKSDRDNIDVSTMMLPNHEERLSMVSGRFVPNLVL
jgi:superfamily II DNA helicase RecQ